MTEVKGVLWDDDMDAFFKQLIPDLVGDIPFISLDIIECLDREGYTDMSCERVAKVIGRPKVIVDKVIKHLADIRVVCENTAGGTFRLEEKNSRLTGFLVFYKTPTGRLKVIEKILGF